MTGYPGSGDAWALVAIPVIGGSSGPTPTSTPVPTATLTPVSTPTPTPNTTIPVFDTTSGAQITSGSSLSWSHTTTTQANRLLLVTISYTQNGTASQVTYNGANLTKVASNACGTGCNNEVYELLNPPSGTHTVSITVNQGTITAGSSTFSNVDQTTPLGTISSAAGNSTSASVTVSASSSQLVLDSLVASGKGGASSANSSQTQLYQNNNYTVGGSSYKTGASSTTMQWNVNPGGGGDTWSLIAIPIR